MAITKKVLGDVKLTDTIVTNFDGTVGITPALLPPSKVVKIATFDVDGRQIELSAPRCDIESSGGSWVAVKNTLSSDVDKIQIATIAIDGVDYPLYSLSSMQLAVDEDTMIQIRKLIGMKALNAYTYIGDNINDIAPKLEQLSSDVIWFDTSDEDDPNTRYNVKRLDNLQYQIYRLSTQMKDLWRVIENGVIPGKVTNNHKDELISLTDKLRIPDYLAPSDTCMSMSIYGPHDLKNNSRYYITFDPAGFDSSKVDINFVIADHDVGNNYLKTITCLSSYVPEGETEPVDRSDVQCQLSVIASEGVKLDDATSTPIYDITLSADIQTTNPDFIAGIESMSAQDKVDAVIRSLKLKSGNRVKLSANTSYVNPEYGPVRIRQPYIAYLDEGSYEPQNYTLSVYPATATNSPTLQHFYATLNETNIYNNPINTNLHWFFLSSYVNDDGEDVVEKVHSTLVTKYEPDAEEEKFAEVEIVNPYDVVAIVDTTLGTGTVVEDLGDMKLKLYVESQYDSSVSAEVDLKLGGSEPTTSLIEPTVKSVSAKRDTFSNFSAHKDTLTSGELLYFTDTKQLAIWDAESQQFVIPSGSGGSGAGSVSREQIKDLGLEYITFQNTTDPQHSKFKVSVSTSGEVMSQLSSDRLESESDLDTSQKTTWGTHVSHLLQISKAYCGGYATDQDCQVSHNCVEIANASNKDICLDNMYIMYYTGDMSSAYANVIASNKWEYMKLNGVIKAGGTFLIRGKQCNPYKNAFMKIDKYDMEWRKRVVTDSEVTRTGDLISFSEDGGAFALVIGENAVINAAKMSRLPNANEGYIDAFSFGSSGFGIDAKQAIKFGTSTIKHSLLSKWFVLDPSKQADKANRKMRVFWTYIDLTKQAGKAHSEEQYYYDDVKKMSYKPHASSENASFFTNKTQFDVTKPNAINVTFGIQATQSATKLASRCFNWVSVGYYDEWLQYKKVKDATGNPVDDGWSEKIYSITPDTTGEWIDPFHAFYDRYRWMASDGTLVTSHKVILHEQLTAGKYAFRVGRDDNEFYTSPEKYFTVHHDDQVKNFSFVQTSDQQGFNWEEYQAWKHSCRAIKKFVPEFNFTLNTGDITQSGNRVSEWLDYFDGRKYIDDKEEMFTIGNNDLCGNPDCELTDGDDGTSKYNLINVKRYYTFELDPNNSYDYETPAGTVKRYNQYAYIKKLVKTQLLDGTDKYTFATTDTAFPIYSLYSFTYGAWHFVSAVSEIGINYYKAFDLIVNDSVKNDSDMYNGTRFAADMNAQVENWFLRDLDLYKHGAQNYSDCIVYMHEMPFTMMTYKQAGIEYYTDHRKNGCKLNDYNTHGTFRFSRLFKKLGIRLIMGGHKHTYTLSKAIYDAPSDSDGNPLMHDSKTLASHDFSIRDYAQLPDTDFLSDPFLSLDVEHNHVAGTPHLTKRPVIQTLTDDSTNTLNNHDVKKMYCRAVKVDKIDAPYYLMCQATGFKLVSNKELPTCQSGGETLPNGGTTEIPWLISYYNSSYNNKDPFAKENVNQHRPTFTVVTLDSVNKNIKFTAYQIDGVYANDSSHTGDDMCFDINDQYITYNTGRSDAQGNVIMKSGLNITSMTFGDHDSLSPTDAFHKPFTDTTGGYNSFINGNEFTITL